jgi:hypothetical protein
VTLSLTFIIAVEQIGPAFVMKSIAGDMIPQDESFEEPGGVRQMPLRR